jgi:hypothetical protein
MTRRHAAPALLALATLSAMASPPAAARDRSQTVAGCRIVYQGTGDGGRLDRARPLFLAWARQARAATEAENEVIARYGEAR